MGTALQAVFVWSLNFRRLLVTGRLWDDFFVCWTGLRYRG
jgi:hypothetical protein